MKNITSTQKIQTVLLALTLLLIASAAPKSAGALSCMNPSEMISNYYVTDDEYVVALIKAGPIETDGAEHEQQVTLVKLYKGDLADQDTVIFNYNETWSYLCAGEPAEAGTEAIYVINDKQVSQVFTPDSELAKKLLSELGEEPTEPTPKPSDPETESPEELSLMRQLIDLLQQFIALLTNAEQPKKSADQKTPTPDYIGLTTAEAREQAEVNGVMFRLVEIDGEPQAVTMDLQAGRINATVENDIVVKYHIE